MASHGVGYGKAKVDKTTASIVFDGRVFYMIGESTYYSQECTNEVIEINEL